MSDFEKTLYLTFSDQQSAADALNAMQYAYRSRLYEWHAHGQCTPSEFIVIFPEGAKSLLRIIRNRWKRQSAEALNSGCSLDKGERTLRYRALRLRD